MAVSPGPIGGAYTVDFARTLVGVADPLTAYAAEAPGQATTMAIPVARGWPARARVLAALAGSPVRNLLFSLAHGPAVTPGGETGYFIICPSPPGPSLAATLRPWSETELVEQVVKPVALVLAALQAKGVTHRAIRPGNMFQSVRGTPVVLGAAWAAPPACHQPSWIESPSSAACAPSARGDGTIAEDVYALGAVLLMLALGANPVEGVPEEEVLYRKLDVGSYAALAGNHRLPAPLAELIRGMLADDPEHRPSPALLATPAAARARRIAAKPIRRATRPVLIGGREASTARTLAHVLQREPAAGITALRNGSVDFWLRRGLGDLLLAGQLEDASRTRDVQANGGDPRADAMLLTSAVALLDPFAPLVWRSVALWPDGLGPALDHAMHHAPDQMALIAEIPAGNVIEAWAKRRAAGRDAPGRVAAGDRTIRPVQLCYNLNPLVPCESPMVKRFWPTRLADLLPAMEASAATRIPDGQAFIDSHAAAFISARRDERLHSDIGHLAANLPPNDVLAQLKLAGRVQAKLNVTPFPHLCGWAATVLQPLIQHFRSKSRRAAIAEELAALAKAGQLSPMAALLEDEAARAADAEGCANAALRVAEIEQALVALGADEARQVHQARRLGQDVASGVGVIACILALAVAVFV